jgi:predicted kinase
MPTLIITRGLPASGKTTRARAWVAEDPARRCRVNRDDVRAMMHAGRLGTPDQERQVTVLRDAAVAALLRKGVDVICDDTLLPARHARDLRRVAQLASAGFQVWDMTDVPLQVCIERDAARTWPAFVGEPVIRDMWTRFLRGQRYPLPLPDEPAGAAGEAAPYVPPAGAPKAIMVDLDGTTALMCGRSPYDETRVGEDRPNPAVIATVRAMHATGHLVIFCSGRTDGCQEATEKWLAEHVAVPYEALHMRAAGDGRKDSIVKVEIFDRHIRHAYNVVAVFDDRASVVAAWRSLGLTVFAVAEGAF